MVQPYIQRVEQHSNKTQTVPQVQKENVPQEKIVVQAYIQRVEQHTNKTSTVPKVQKENVPQEKIVVQPFIQRIEQHKTDKEVVPQVENKVQNVDKIEVVPYIQRIEQHKTDREVVPQVKRDVKNEDKIVVQPYIQRIEEHKTDREVVPKVENKVQNQDKIEVVPFIQREEKHTTQKQVLPQTKEETKRIVKKVIQPIIKDIIQPVHIKIKPELREGIKPTIFKKDEVRPVINQGTKTAETIIKETKVEKEVNAGVKVRESIVRSSVLPTDNKGVIVKKEIISTNVSGMGASGVQSGLGLENVEFSQAINAEGIHKEIIAGTTVRQSIVRSSVLPTIDGGTKVLKTIFGGVRKSTLPPGAEIQLEGVSAEGSAFTAEGAGEGLATTTTLNAVNTIKTNDVIDLGTKVHKTINLGVVNAGESQINTLNAGTIGTTGLIMGQNVDNARMGLITNTTQSQINQMQGIGSSGISFTTSKILPTQIQGMGNNGSAIGLVGEGNNSVGMSYMANTNNNVQAGVNTLEASAATSQFGNTKTIITKNVQYNTISGQPIVGTSNILNPIVKTTIKQPIITGNTMNFQTNDNHA